MTPPNRRDAPRPLSRRLTGRALVLTGVGVALALASGLLPVLADGAFAFTYDSTGRSGTPQRATEVLDELRGSPIRIRGFDRPGVVADIVRAHTSFDLTGPTPLSPADDDGIIDVPLGEIHGVAIIHAGWPLRWIETATVSTTTGTSVRPITEFRSRREISVGRLLINVVVWPTGLALLLATGRSVIHGIRSLRTSLGHCRGCGYDCHGIRATRCPECGLEHPLSPSPSGPSDR